MPSKIRHTKRRHCPLCDGYDELPRGQGKRCHGFTVGEFTHCGRDELAGNLPQEAGGTYCHRMVGDCKCGLDHNFRPAPISIGRKERRPAGHTSEPCGQIIATYDYRDEGGELLYQVVRYEPKTFRQRRPDGHGGHVWNLEGVPRFLYRLPELCAAGPDEPVFYVEGEKDADRLAAGELVATTNSEGAGKFPADAAQQLAGRQVIILPDNDAAGIAHAERIAAALYGIAASIKIVPLPGLPEHGDVSDWLDAGNDMDELRRWAHVWPEWRPPVSSDAPLIAEQFAALERDVEEAQEKIIEQQRDLATADRENTRLKKRCNKQDELITTIEQVFESRTTKLEAKAPFARLLIARYHDPRFAEAEERPVPLWQGQFSEMMGGADPKTVRTWIQTIGAENLATIIKEPTGRAITLPSGKTVPQERYAIQLGPDPDRAPVSLATWRELMCKPKADAKRRERKRYERRCPDHSTAALRRDYHCTECERLVHQDTVAPQAAENCPFIGKISPSSLNTGEKISRSEPLMLPPPSPGVERPDRESFPITAVCACGSSLVKGQDCPHCNDRACRECGELTGSALRAFCVPYCRHAPLESPAYTKPPAERLAAMAATGAA